MIPHSLLLLFAAFKSTRFEAVGSLRGRELDSSAYSSTGSVYQSVFINTDGTATDDTCSNLSAVIGYVVNKCIINPGYAYKFQLTSGKDCCCVLPSMKLH